MYLTEAAVGAVQEASWQLSSCRSLRELEDSALAWLESHFACNHAAYTDYPTSGGAIRLKVKGDGLLLSELARATREHVNSGPATDHPLVTHYFMRWSPLTPLRISDLMTDRELRRSRVYGEVLALAGATRQMALVSRRVSPLDNSGYTIDRDGRDFSRAELDLAVALQPLLFALHKALGAPRVRVSSTVAASPESDVILTRAEQDVLELLATGLTAAAIGRIRRTSARTVNKHLESIYTKLGRHDRLQVVLYACQIGLLPSDAVVPGEVAPTFRISSTPSVTSARINAHRRRTYSPTR